MSPTDEGYVDYDENGRPRPTWGDRSPAYAVACLGYDRQTRRCTTWTVLIHQNRANAHADYCKHVAAVEHAAVVLAAVAGDGTVVPMQDCMSPIACRRVNGSRHLMRWDVAAELIRYQAGMVRTGGVETYVREVVTLDVADQADDPPPVDNQGKPMITVEQAIRLIRRRDERMTKLRAERAKQEGQS